MNILAAVLVLWAESPIAVRLSSQMSEYVEVSFFKICIIVS